MYVFARFCALYFVSVPCSMPRQALRSGSARPIFHVNFTIGCMSRTSPAAGAFPQLPALAPGMEEALPSTGGRALYHPSMCRPKKAAMDWASL